MEWACCAWLRVLVCLGLMRAVCGVATDVGWREIIISGGVMCPSPTGKSGGAGQFIPTSINGGE